MTGARFVLVIALAGCGRLGFRDVADAPGDGERPTDPEHLTLVVVSDEYGSDRIGTPIPGATVLVDRGAGRGAGLERSVTDDQGTARFAIAGVVACHVVFKGDLGWRLYTIVAPRAGTIELGGRPEVGINLRMTFALPTSATAGDYTIRVDEHCGRAAYVSGPSVQLEFDHACLGKPERVLAFARNSATDVYLDAGEVTLADAATYQLTGTYQPVPTHKIQVADLPVGTTSMEADLLARVGLDLVPLSPTPSSVAAQGRSATQIVDAAPGGDTLRVAAFGATGLPYLASSERITPTPLASVISVSAAAMLPLFDTLDAAHPPSLAWTGGDGGTILAVEANAGAVQWDAYLEPTATALAFPEIPADLQVPIPKAFDYVSLTKLAVPGATAADLIRTIDRRWLAWPHDDLLFPAEGAASTHMLYTRALGPPVTASAAAGGSPRASRDPDRAAAAGSTARARPAGPGGARSPARTARSAE
jgi:hypothetical protein